jgi:hypothetical protein
VVTLTNKFGGLPELSEIGRMRLSSTVSAGPCGSFPTLEFWEQLIRCAKRLPATAPVFEMLPRTVRKCLGYKASTVLAAVALTLLLRACLSIAGPVRRALHVDPANVLREQ